MPLPYGVQVCHLSLGVADPPAGFSVVFHGVSALGTGRRNASAREARTRPRTRARGRAPAHRHPKFIVGKSPGIKPAPGYAKPSQALLPASGAGGI